MTSPKIDIDNDEIFDLERLITDGTNAIVPIIVEFPVYANEKLTTKKYALNIKPIKSYDIDNATRIGLKNPKTDFNTELVKRGLCNTDGDLLPSETVEKLPAGVVTQLAEKICEISGIRQDTEVNKDLLKEMMGF